MQENEVSLTFDQVKNVLLVFKKVPITQRITEYSGPTDVMTLSNGMQVGRLSTRTANPYGYPMFLIGNKQVNPCSKPGSQYLKAFMNCLDEHDRRIVEKIAAVVEVEKLSNGK